MRFHRRVLLVLLPALALIACAAPDQLVVPIGVFVSGAPDGAVVSVQAPVVTTPTTTWGKEVTYTWHVDFTSVQEIPVDEIVIDVPDLEGHFVVPLEPEEIAAGSIDVPMWVGSQEAGETVCQRDYRGIGTCYTPMTQGTTDLGFAAGNEPDPAAPEGGIGLSAGSVVEIAVVGSPPTSGACAETWMPASCACTVEACCPSTEQCWYEVNGSTWFPCDGADCMGTIQAVAAFCGCSFDEG